MSNFQAKSMSTLCRPNAMLMQTKGMNKQSVRSSTKISARSPPQTNKKRIPIRRRKEIHDSAKYDRRRTRPNSVKLTQINNAVVGVVIMRRFGGRSSGKR